MKFSKVQHFGNSGTFDHKRSIASRRETMLANSKIESTENIHCLSDRGALLWYTD